MNERVQRLPAFRCLAGIGTARCREVDGRISGGNPSVVDIRKLFPRIPAEQKAMVQEMVVLAIEPEVEDHPATGWRVLPTDLRLLVERSIVAHEVAVGSLHVAITDHQIGLDDSPILKLDAGGSFPVVNDLLHPGSQDDLGLLLAKNLLQTRRDHPRATHRVAATMIHLRRGNQSEDRRCQEWTRSDVLKEMLAELRHMRFPNVLVDRRPDVRMHPHRKDILEDPRLRGRGRPHHVWDSTDVLVEEDLFAQPVHSSAVVDEGSPAVADPLPRELLIERRHHRFKVAAKVEHRSVFVHAAPLGVEIDNVHVVRNRPPRSLDDAADHLRHREDGRPHVEGEPGLLQDVHLSAEMLIAIDDRDIQTPGAEFDRRGQAGQSAPDYHRAGSFC